MIFQLYKVFIILNTSEKEIDPNLIFDYLVVKFLYKRHDRCWIILFYLPSKEKIYSLSSSSNVPICMFVAFTV